MKALFQSSAGRAAACVWIALALLLAAPPARAHENTPGVMAMKEVEAGRFLVRWSPPSPEVGEWRVRFPDACRVEGSSSLQLNRAQEALPALLDCGNAGLGGELRFEASSGVTSRIAVNVEWLDGDESFRFADGEPPSVLLGAATRPNRALEVLQRYGWLGVEHIWFGVDHLLFLLGLLILVRGWKSLLGTVTAFTVAHSLTLGAASLELVAVPTSPVELCIALSVLLLAVEATRGPETASRRWPWLVAFGFGLLHGLGFASALSEVGLPKDAMLLSLFGFNLGVEAGQLAAVSVAASIHLLSKRRPALQRGIEHAAIWTLGVSAVFWLLQRVESWIDQFPPP